MRLSRRSLVLSSATSPFLLHGNGMAQTTSPKIGDLEPARNRLQEMLGYVPGGKLDDEMNIIWNDYQQQVTAIREMHGESVADLSDGELAMRSHYANFPQFKEFTMMLEELAGYTLDNLDQAIEFGLPPATGLVVRVKDNPEDLISFWESVDYQEKENKYGAFWTIGEEGEMDLAHPVQSRMIARFNNIAILDDATIAYAPTSQLLSNIQAVAAGEHQSKADELQPLFEALPSDTTSTWFLSGEMLMFEGLIGGEMTTAESLERLEDVFESSNEAAGSMPVIRTICAGITAGASLDEEMHNPDSIEFLILETDVADMAQQAADVVTWRRDNMDSLTVGAPYSEILPDLETEVVSPDLVRCENPLNEAPPRFNRMLLSRDTLLFAYRVGDE